VNVSAVSLAAIRGYAERVLAWAGWPTDRRRLAGAVPLLNLLRCNARNGMPRSPARHFNVMGRQTMSWMRKEQQVICGRSLLSRWYVLSSAATYKLLRGWKDRSLAVLAAPRASQKYGKRLFSSTRCGTNIGKVTISRANVGWEYSLRVLSRFESNGRLRH
jgi:hypothetical protein